MTGAHRAVASAEDRQKIAFSMGVSPAVLLQAQIEALSVRIEALKASIESAPAERAKIELLLGLKPGALG